MAAEASTAEAEGVAVDEEASAASTRALETTSGDGDSGAQQSATPEGAALEGGEDFSGEFTGTDEDWRRMLLFGLTLVLRQVLPLVVKVDEEDLEIAFGCGEEEEESGGTVQGSLVLSGEGAHRLSIQLHKDAGTSGHAVADEAALEEEIPVGGGEIPVAWLGFFDRMEGGLGYGRMLHRRLLQGQVFPDLFQKAWDLVRWDASEVVSLADAHEGDEAFSPFATSLWYEEEDERGACAETIRTNRAAKWGVRTLLENLIPLTTGRIEGREESALHAPLTADELGRPAKIGLGDLLELGDVEKALSKRVTPVFDVGGDSPWAVAYLCHLLSEVSDPKLRRAVEKATMVQIVVNRREGDPNAPALPVGVDVLNEFPGLATATKLSEVPDLCDGTGTALEARYGALAEAMGLLVAGELTERGHWVARTLREESPGFDESFAEIVAAAREGRLP